MSSQIDGQSFEPEVVLNNLQNILQTDKEKLRNDAEAAIQLLQTIQRAEMKIGGREFEARDLGIPQLEALIERFSPDEAPKQSHPAMGFLGLGLLASYIAGSFRRKPA